MEDFTLKIRGQETPPSRNNLMKGAGFRHVKRDIMPKETLMSDTLELTINQLPKKERSRVLKAIKGVFR